VFRHSKDAEEEQALNENLHDQNSSNDNDDNNSNSNGNSNKTYKHNNKHH